MTKDQATQLLFIMYVMLGIVSAIAGKVLQA